MDHRSPVFSGGRRVRGHATDCEALSGKLLDNLDRGNYAAAGSDFDGKMKTLGPEKLKQLWQKIPEKLGARGAREEARFMRKNGSDIVFTPLHFGDRIANAQVVCSADGQITGFHVVAQP